MTSAVSEPTTTDPIDELRDWLAENWDPELTVEEWWERLGLAGWAAPILPPDRYGRGLSRGDVVRVAQTIAASGALGAPFGMGPSLASPTIATHGNAEQVERYVRDAVTGKRAWCQLFSEPGAGSDLAGLTTRAVRDGDVWIINGQKVWTSGGHLADLGMLLARTEPTAPKHQGITWFALDMHQPGVEVRPLREMTGNTMFSEVFFTNAVVRDDARIGEVNNGWTVANTTLSYERSGMGAGGRGRIMLGARAGSVAGDLDKRAGDFVKVTPVARGATQQRTSPAATYIRLAHEFGKDADPVVRQGLAQSHIFGELTRTNTERHKAMRAAGRDIPGVANFGKLLMAHTLRHNRDLSMQILGARGTLHSYSRAGDGWEAFGEADTGGATNAITAQVLSAQALPIFGGTDQIQRNIIGERVLGLPKEPGDLSRVPFNELPQNG
jgi:alkylation response protein AidB-like acyl-CoA dehydrogenase